MKAVILAAGHGKRMLPLSEILPKPLLPINGVPILETTLTSLAQSGVREAAIIVEYMAGMIENFVGDGSRFGLSAVCIRQGEARGTGHAVAVAGDFLEGEIAVAAGDTAFSPTHVGGTVDLFHRAKAGAALCLKRLSPEKLAQTSSVEIDNAGTILRFVEKPPIGSAPSEYAAALLHVYNRDLRECLASLKPSPRGEIELPDVLDGLRTRGHKIVGKAFPTPPDLTSPEDLLRLNFDYIDALLEAPRQMSAS